MSRRADRAAGAAGMALLLAIGLGVASNWLPAPSMETEPPSMEKDGFACTVTRVHDGDGPIWCAEGPRIRLQGVAARELDGTCSAGHPCPDASAAAAKAELERLAMGQVLRCRQVGTSYNRVVAWCARADGADLSCAMVRSGTALRWPRYDPEGRLTRC